ncbi:DUF6429 family protein [Halofilum ochraceum]|uniref:DUF6429 family protein n=1 Tax=Halofilum ochraceum TaxID=1611323 RepID=UPI000834EEAF|nr:DUF6429 family protein [Halofilum ochraceum]
MTGEPDLDEDRLAEAALALMSLTLHDGDRVWKQYPWSLTDRLFDLGYITDPKSKAKSVQLTPEGKVQAERVLRERFGRGGGSDG